MSGPYRPEDQDRHQGCPFRELYPAVLVVQAAKDIACGDGSAVLDGPVVRGIFPQTKMGPRSIIIMHVPIQDVPKMRGIPDDGVVETFTSDRTDNPLDITILPW